MGMNGLESSSKSGGLVLSVNHESLSSYEPCRVWIVTFDRSVADSLDLIIS